MNIQYPGSDQLKINANAAPGSQPMHRPEALIKADNLAYLIWDVADIEEQESFLLDFGMLTHQKSSDELYMRSYGDSPYVYWGRKAKKTAFVGMGFTAVSREDLVKLAEATGEPIEPLDRPGSGEVVRLSAPEGLVVEVAFGIEPLESVETRMDLPPTNTLLHKPRINRGQRPELIPSPILNIGHCVTGTNNFEKTTNWYMRHLGLIPSDVQCLDDGSNVLAFMRLDRGANPADHHTLVVGQGLGVGYQHSAYEVFDLDVLGQGQQYLKLKKRDHFWGIGRHILGSQLFDYWNDPHGFEFEHYTDGDVFTAEHPTDYHIFDAGNVYAWGPDMPAAMTSPTTKQILDLIRGLISGDMTMGWIKLFKKATSRPSRPWL